ncbi:MAG: leucyl/phenylalanyl-tRNA--protein transferase [Lautropia sp.]|nr:leucyl/phenylalanyl-tRNA--protein transferase [Lautropia sp.]
MRQHWVDPHTPLPPPDQDVPGYPGLIALGTDLSAERLLEAYRQGMFPWYSDGQPVLWWSPDPRMVVFVDTFRPPRSLRQLLKQLHRQSLSDQAPWRLSLDRAFERVMRACAAPREADGGGTWITEDIIRAYTALHQHGHAHSVEVWEGDTLIGGLYGVGLGRMFYGESMFTRRPNASKCAFAALMHLLRQQGFHMVDCQQSTAHLRSLGGQELARPDFLARLPALLAQPTPDWSTLRLSWPHDWPLPPATPSVDPSRVHPPEATITGNTCASSSGAASAP